MAVSLRLFNYSPIHKRRCLFKEGKRRRKREEGGERGGKAGEGGREERGKREGGREGGRRERRGMYAGGAARAAASLGSLPTVVSYAARSRYYEPLKAIALGRLFCTRTARIQER